MPPSTATFICTAEVPATGLAARARRSVRMAYRLPSTAAFYLQVSILVVFLAGSSAPTPLYSVYQAEWGFSPITTTIVFGVYALAVLSALLTVGSLSDHIGRKPVLLVAIALQAATMVVFAAAAGVPELLLARVVQGLSTGAAVGALGAAMIDLDRVKGTIASGVGAMTGTATGALVAGFFIQFLPAPTHLVYEFLFGVFVLQGIGVLLMRESSSPKVGALASLRPQLAVPAAARTPMLIAAPAFAAVWALAGFYASLGPILVREITGSHSAVLAGLALFVLAGCGALTSLVLRDAPGRATMMAGTISLVVGVGTTLVAIELSSAALFFLGAVLAGAGFGAGFQGGLRTVVPLAHPHERAGVLSTIYVVCYLALGLPAVVAGFLVVYGGGLLATAREYGLAVMLLAGLALLGLVRSHEPKVVATS